MTRAQRLLLETAALACFLSAWGLFSYVLMARVTFLLVYVWNAHVPVGMDAAMAHLVWWGLPYLCGTLFLYGSALLAPPWGLVGLLYLLRSFVRARRARVAYLVPFHDGE
jgi:hypothetical protein